MIAYIQRAIALNLNGIRAAPRVKAKTENTPLFTPDYFQARLDENPEAKTHFEKFSRSQKKENLSWLAEAKTEVTRDKRADTAIAWISEGKIKN